jgi:hypothetical protein
MKNMHLQDLEIFEILKSHFKKQDGKNEKNKKERQTTSNNTKGSALVFGCFGGVTNPSGKLANFVAILRFNPMSTVYHHCSCECHP